MSIRRVIAAIALLVCRVENTRWPVKRRLDGDARGFEVANFADHDDIRILTQDRTQRDGKIETDLRLDLNLIDPGKLILDRIFHGEQLQLGPIEILQRRVERRRLAAAGRAGDRE